ncbi:MAG: hypothetical protein OXP71_13575 [Candidatus Poribacteria bacterium]|nr:hypothetical protein [Candidatus Poribacteria bacterium]
MQAALQLGWFIFPYFIDSCAGTTMTASGSVAALGSTFTGYSVPCAATNSSTLRHQHAQILPGAIQNYNPTTAANKKDNRQRLNW